MRSSAPGDAGVGGVGASVFVDVFGAGAGALGTGRGAGVCAPVGIGETVTLGSLVGRSGWVKVGPEGRGWPPPVAGAGRQRIKLDETGGIAG